jgi:MinD-like ATPase involved in chromosome partitioning or flagellar assembly
MSVSSQKSRVFTVWSPAGSPGRTTVAASIAVELAKQGNRTLVIDADSYGPAIEFQFGIDQSSSGIAAVARAAIQERLDDAYFKKLTAEFVFGKVELQIITGLSMPDRWQEVGFDGITAILEYAQKQFDCIVIDVAAPIELQIIHEKSLVQRNSMTIASLRAAHQIIAVCGSKDSDVHRFVWDYQQLKSLQLPGELKVLVNQLRTANLGRNASKQIADTIKRLTGCQVQDFIDFDQAAADRAKADGVPLALAGRNSSARAQLSKFVLTKLG